MEYESSINYHSKAMANLKVLADKQKYKVTDKQTGQKLHAPDLLMRRHKNHTNIAVSNMTELR